MYIHKGDAYISSFALLRVLGKEENVSILCHSGMKKFLQNVTRVVYDNKHFYNQRELYKAIRHKENKFKEMVNTQRAIMLLLDDQSEGANKKIATELGFKSLVHLHMFLQNTKWSYNADMALDNLLKKYPKFYQQYLKEDGV